jgi:hypothetical protein
MVGPRALDFAAAVLRAAPEITAADDDADLNTKVDALFNNGADVLDHIEIKPEMLVSR